DACQRQRAVTPLARPQNLRVQVAGADPMRVDQQPAVVGPPREPTGDAGRAWPCERQLRGRRLRGSAAEARRTLDDARDDGGAAEAEPPTAGAREARGRDEAGRRLRERDPERTGTVEAAGDDGQPA